MSVVVIDTKFSSDLRETLAWFSTAYRRLQRLGWSGYVGTDFVAARDALIRRQKEWPLLAKLDLGKRGDEIQASMPRASSNRIGIALDKLAAEVKVLEKELADLGATLKESQP